MAAERLGGIGFELGGAFAGGMKLQDPAARRGADLAAPFLGNVAQESDHVLGRAGNQDLVVRHEQARSEEHTSELQSLMRISYAVFCLQKKKNSNIHVQTANTKP